MGYRIFLFSPACVYTAELLSWRRRPLTQVSEKLLHGSRPNLMGSYLFTISKRSFFFFLNFKFSRLVFVFVNMGPYGSQNCKTLFIAQIDPEFCETLWNNILTKLPFRIVEILNFNEFSSFSLTCDPMGAKIAQRYSFHISRPNLFKLFLNFCLRYPHKATFSDF